MANESINLNLIPEGEMPVIHASQFDNGRQFNIKLFKGSDEYTLPAGYTASLNCRKADRNIVTLPVTTASTNILTFTTTTQLCACAGNNLCEVVIKDAEDYQVGTLNFILAVEKDPLQGGIDSTSEIHDLTDQIEEITTEIVGENYYNKTETDTLLDAKANAADVYTKTQTDNLLNAKANAADVYTKTQVDNALSAKANAADVYTKTQVDNALSAKANAADVYTKTQTDNLLNAKANAADVYTKTQVDNALSAKANSADLATVATTGDYDDLLNKPTIPAAQVQSDYAQVDDTQVDYIKNKPDLSKYAKESELILATGTENETPYQTRIAPSNIGNMALEKLVGVSVCFNQLAKELTNANWNNEGGVTSSYSDGVCTFSSTTANNGIKSTVNFKNGHKYFITADFYSADELTVAFGSNSASGCLVQLAIGSTDTGKWITKLDIASCVNDFNDFYAFGRSVYTDLKVRNINCIDLTAMFGSEVADYLYTLESGTAGAGVSLFKTLFADEYYPYTANTLMSAKPTSKVIKDSNNQTVATVNFSGNELRGLLKVGTNGLYADGDIDDGSGSTAVRYEERAYISGDESLPNAITDGTNTVVKLTTPTTATSTAWTNPIVAKEGGTEEFTDSRTIKMPTGHDTIYSKKPNYRYWG